MAIDAQQLFADERNSGFCVFCGGEPTTRDHVPSKILLDEPYPSDLPVVSACNTCNNGFSLDEEYLACLLECALKGSAKPEGVDREKIKRILAARPDLAARIEQGASEDSSGGLMWSVEHDRVQKIVVKLARGHLAYDLSEPHLEAPDSVTCIPLVSLSEQQRADFETVSASGIAGWPEVGSRAFIRACYGGDSGWIVVQPNRYRYFVANSGRANVRIVLSEYLACEVTWP